MKKIINISFFVLFLACLFLLFYKKKDDEITLNVYNWGDFIATKNNGGIDVNELFTQKTGIKINYTTFQSNEEMLAKILGGGASYDVIFPSDYILEKLIKENMLEELDFNNIPNYKYLDSSLKNFEFDPENKFAVPYLYGFLGIFYNNKFVKENNNNIDWDILWNKKYAKKIIMFDNPRDDLAIALLKNKKSINSNNKNDWILATEELKNQRELVQSYMSDQILDKLLGEEVYIAPFYYGHTAQDENLRNNKNIKFVIPKSATNKFVDFACILKNSRHKSEAEKYINFLLTDEVSQANAQATGYLPANKNISEELISNSEALKNYDMKKSYVYRDLSPEISKLNDESWVNIRAGEENLDFYNIILIFIFCLLIILNVIIFFRRFKNNREYITCSE